MTYACAFADELQKIAASGGIRSKLFGLGRKLGLVETETDAAKRTIGKVMRSLPSKTPAGTPLRGAPSPQAHAQLKQMKLQRQLEAMKRERGLL